MTFMASWPGGESAHESEQAAQNAADASGHKLATVWEIDDEPTDPNYTEGIRGRQSGAERERP